MAKQPISAFDDVAAAFADYGTTVRGYVRYQLTRRNLKPYLKGTKKLDVLDVGGGSGGDAAWLAGLGHKVTYLEPSMEQRRFAERRFNFLLNEKTRPRIIMAGDTLDDLPAKQKFDLVMVHTVASFQDDPGAFLRQAVKHVKPGGLLSIIEKGYYGTELRAIRDADYTDLRRLRRTGKSVNDLKQTVHAFKPETIETWLKRYKFEILEWSGIRVLTDEFTMPAERLPAAELKLILDTEYKQGHHPAIRGQGQLLHFIARRPD